MGFGSWGWVGKFLRALELPDGQEQDSVSQEGRARIRYHGGRNQLEVSLDGAPYGPLETSSSGALSQASWYINANTGSDENDGETSLTALATFAEWSSRMAGGTATVAMTVTIETDLAEAGYFIDGAFPFMLNVIGLPTATLLAGSITAIQDWDTTVSPIDDGQLTDSAISGSWTDSGPGGSSLVKKKVIMTSGAEAGKHAWIIKDLGAKVARVSQFNDPATFSVGDPGVGDAFNVVEMPNLSGGTFFVQGSNSSGDAGVILTNLTFSGAPQRRGLSCTGRAIILRGCYLNGTGCDLAGIGTGSVTTHGCFFGTIGQPARFIGAPQASMFSCAGDSSPLVSAGASLNIAFLNCFQSAGNGVELLIQRGGEVSVSNFGSPGSIGVLDTSLSSGGAARVGAGCQLSVFASTKVWTLGQTLGHGVWIDSGGSCYWPSGANATAHFDFTTATDEFDIATTSLTVAALGLTGSFNPSGRGAAAVPKEG